MHIKRHLGTYVFLIFFTDIIISHMEFGITFLSISIHQKITKKN